MAFLAAILAWLGLSCCIGMTLDAIERPYPRRRYVIVRKKRKRENNTQVAKNEELSEDSKPDIVEAILVDN